MSDWSTIEPDYQNCCTNLSSSILAYYGVSVPQPGHPVVDRLLVGKRFSKILLFLMDGLSLDALQRHLPANSLLRSRMIHTMSAVFPATTAAAITSILSALNPGQHGWLGWTLYFAQLQTSVDILPNTLQYTRDQAAAFHVAEQFLPYTTILELISNTGTQVHYLSAHARQPVVGLDKLLDGAKAVMKSPDPAFAYVYWNEPDHLIHLKGCGHPDVGQKVFAIEEGISQLAEELPRDTLLLITADHGLIDAVPDYLDEHPALGRMLLRPPVVEARAAALYVHTHERPFFQEAFMEAFGDRYRLLTARQLLTGGLLGTPSQAFRPGIEAFVGDFFAIALGTGALYPSRDRCHIIGMHGGLTMQEMQVPLIALHI
jgi:hypothetical protein